MIKCQKRTRYKTEEQYLIQGRSIHLKSFLTLSKTDASTFGLTLENHKRTFSFPTKRITDLLWYVLSEYLELYLYL